MERFVIWMEDTAGNVIRAFTHVGRAADGIARARAEAREMNQSVQDIWATPVSPENINWRS